MKKLNFAIAMLVAIVTLNLDVFGQTALKPYNALASSIQEWFTAPKDMNYAGLFDALNKMRDSKRMGYLSQNDILKYLPKNAWNNSYIVTRGRTFPYAASQLKTDFWSRYMMPYKIWHYSNIEPIGFGDFNDYNVAARILPQLPGVGIIIPEQVQIRLLETLKGEHKYVSGEFIPGDVLLFSSYHSNGRDVVWATTLAMPVVLSGNSFSRVWHIPNRQMQIPYQGKTYVFCFVRGQNSNGDWLGCNNFGCFIADGEYSNPTDKNKGEGDNDVTPTNQPPHDPIPPNPNPPNPPIRCDTVKGVDKDGKPALFITCGGNIIIISNNNTNTNCCPSAGGVVQPPVVVPPNPIPPQRKDTLVVIPITPINPGPVIPYNPNPVSIISNGTTTNQPCDCSGPLVDGFIYTQASVYYDTAYTRNADVELGLNIYPTRSWWGVGLRSGLFGVTENRGEALSGWILAGASGRFYPWSESMVKLTAGLFGANNDLKWRLYRFDNMPWRPVPVAPPYKGLIPMGFNVKQGAGVNMEFYETSLGLGFEARHLKGFSGINYEESYLDLRFNLNDQGSSLRTYWWNQHKGQYNISVPNDFGGTTNYYIAPTISEEWGVRFAFRLKADNQPSRAVAGVMGRLGLTSATSGRYNPLDGNAITGYVALMSQYLGTVDFFGWRRGIGLGFIVNNWPGSRCFVEARYMFFPGTVLGSEIMQNFQRVPVFFQDRNTGLWNVRWEDQYSGVNTHGIMLAFSYFF